MRWPQVIRAGQVSHQLVHQADIMATLAAIWNEALPDNAGEDSFNLLPLLQAMTRRFAPMRLVVLAMVFRHCGRFVETGFRTG